MTNIESINLIARNPKVSGGRPYIIGTGLNVSDIVMAKVYNLQTPDQMVFSFGVTLAEVYAALAHYYVDRDEIDADKRDQIKTACLLQILVNCG